MASPSSLCLPSRARSVALYGALGVVAYAVLAATCDAPRAHLDTARDWLMARDCLAGDCPSVGAGASVLGLKQGALWIRFLATGLGLGLDAQDLQRVLLALQALGAVVVAAAVRALAARAWPAPEPARAASCWRGEEASPRTATAPPSPRLVGARASGAGWRAALFSLGYVVLLRALEVGDTLWNPLLAHPGAALFGAGLALVLVGRGALFGALAGLGLALAVLGHVFAISFVPLLVFGALLAPRRPGLALLGASMALALPVGLDSWEALSINAAVFVERGLVAPFAGAILLAGVAALTLRRRWRAIPAERRALPALVALSGVVLAVGLWLPVVLGQTVSERYHFLLPPLAASALALGLDRGIGRLPERWRRAAPCAVVGLLLMAAVAAGRRNDHGGPTGVWRLPEVERLGRDLFSRGLGYAELHRRLQGPGSADLVAMLGALDPHALPGPAEAGPDGALLVLRLGRSAVPDPLPPTWRVVDLSDRFVALLREAPPGLLARGLEACHAEPGAPACVAVELAWREGPEARWFDRQYPAALPREECRARTSGARAWRFTVDASAGPVRALLPDPTSAGCRWTFDGGGTDRVVERAPGLQRVTVSTTLGGACSERCWPPALVVAPADDPVVSAFLAEAPDPE